MRSHQAEADIDRRIRGTSAGDARLPLKCGSKPARPALAAALFPLMDVDGAELGELVDDIPQHGLAQPVVRFEGRILDGLHAYQHAGVELSQG